MCLIPALAIDDRESALGRFLSSHCQCLWKQPHCDCPGQSWKYLAISGCVSDATDATYISWFLVSCQVTGYDISMGDADTITEASIDFTVMDPFAVAYNVPCIMDC